jgi:hypothetical protein
MKSGRLCSVVSMVRKKDHLCSLFLVHKHFDKLSPIYYGHRRDECVPRIGNKPDDFIAFVPRRPLGSVSFETGHVKGYK